MIEDVYRSGMDLPALPALNLENIVVPQTNTVPDQKAEQTVESALDGGGLEKLP